ncbi:MAG TPA: acyltransferase [Bryobacteraceae bacterium]|nr:acyltransferase [Bryobacteraceae bacterium]
MPALDGLRGIAILLVMFHHFQIIAPGQGTQAVLFHLSEFGPHGVDLFFVLSGFLITGILLDSRQHPHYFRNFYARRTLRIFPLYYLVVAFSVLVLPAAIAAVPAASSKLARFATTAADWPWYVFYVSNFLIAKTGDWRHPVLGVTWSLAIEEQFYLVWAVVVFFLFRRRVESLALALVVVSLIIRAAVLYSDGSWITAYVITPCRCDAIGLGAFLAAAMRGPEPTWEALARISTWVAFAGTPLLLGLYGAGVWSYNDPAALIYGYTPVALVCVAWLRLALAPHAHPLVAASLGNGALRFFGKYSYSIYLIHLPLRAAIRDTIFAAEQTHSALGSGLLYQFAFDVAATAAVVPLALLSWKLLESPFLSLKRFFPQ